MHHCAVLCHQHTVHRLIGLIALRHINGAKLSAAAEGVLLDYRHICRDRDLRQTLTVNERLKADRLHTFGQCKVLQLITPHKGQSSDYLRIFGEYDRLQLCTFLEHARFDDFQISRQLDKLQIGALGENVRLHRCHSVGEFDPDQTGFTKSATFNFRQARRKVHAFQISAAAKCTVWECRQLFGQTNTLQSAGSENPIPHFLYGIRKGDLRQAFAAAKGILADLHHRVRDRNLCQVFATDESIAADRKDTAFQLILRPIDHDLFDLIRIVLPGNSVIGKVLHIALAEELQCSVLHQLPRHVFAIAIVVIPIAAIAAVHNGPRAAPYGGGQAEQHDHSQDNAQHALFHTLSPFLQSFCMIDCTPCGAFSQVIICLFFKVLAIRCAFLYAERRKARCAP